jgi:hypothetical protein
MGWQELRERAKQFQQQTDAALANDIKQDTLLSRAKVSRRRSYACVSEISSGPPSVGGEVRLIDMHDRIDVYVNNRPIGQVDPTQAERMRKQQRFADRQGRSVLGRIAKVSSVTNGFSVTVADSQ